jgi:hypothetical protein
MQSPPCADFLLYDSYSCSCRSFRRTLQNHIHRVLESSLTRASTGRDFPPYSLD